MSNNDPTNSEAVWQLLHGTPDLLCDLPAWSAAHPKAKGDSSEIFKHFWITRQDFRSVIHYRVKTQANPAIKQGFDRLCSKSWFFVPSLHLSCKDIGPGFYIEHGFSTVVFAKKIGANFRLNQTVTIGNGKNGYPTLGDNVSVYAGAIVIGGVTIGNHVKIGAGAVVIEDIPDHSTVVPAKSRVISNRAGGV